MSLLIASLVVLILALLCVAVAVLYLRPPLGEREHAYRRRRNVPVAVDRRKPR